VVLFDLLEASVSTVNLLDLLLEICRGLVRLFKWWREEQDFCTRNSTKQQYKKPNQITNYLIATSSNSSNHNRALVTRVDERSWVICLHYSRAREVGSVRRIVFHKLTVFIPFSFSSPSTTSVSYPVTPSITLSTDRYPWAQPWWKRRRLHWRRFSSHAKRWARKFRTRQLDPWLTNLGLLLPQSLHISSVIPPKSLTLRIPKARVSEVWRTGDESEYLPLISCVDRFHEADLDHCRLLARLQPSQGRVNYQIFSPTAGEKNRRDRLEVY